MDLILPCYNSPMENPFAGPPKEEGLAKAKKIDSGIEKFAKLKEVLARLPLPERYKKIGIKTSGDESGAVIEVWQSDEAMAEGEPHERIARIAIDLLEGKIRVHLDSTQGLDKHLIVSDFDLQHEGETEDDILASIKKDIESGVNPFENTQVGRIRDPRIQAIINYIVKLEKAGLRFEYDENRGNERRLATAVREEQLELLESEARNMKVLDNQSQNLPVKNKASGLSTQIDKIKEELNHLRELNRQSDEREEERLRKLAENPIKRDRRSRRRFEV